jgi:hypothetical protein
MAPKLSQTEIPALWIKCNPKMKVLKVNILTEEGDGLPENDLSSRGTNK